MTKLGFKGAALAAMIFVGGGTALAQVQTVDPNAAMQSDLAPVPSNEASYGTQMSNPSGAAPSAPSAASAPSPGFGGSADAQPDGAAAPGAEVAHQPNFTGASPAAASRGATFQQNDVLSAAEGVFGKGAQGLARMIQSVLHDQGEPNAYIVGREASAAFAVGLRYGSGTMVHKVEGQRPVYWTGPSLGFDFGANGAKSFVLVYNLYDSQELYHRFPSAEGTAYVIGGFTASYLRRGDVVLIPIRLGVGWRLGVNVGYMKFTDRSRWMPF